MKKLKTSKFVYFCILFVLLIVSIFYIYFDGKSVKLSTEDIYLKTVLMRDLNINDGRDIFFIGHSQNKSFMFLQISQVEGGSYYVVVKNINDKWVSVAEGQEYPTCAIINKYQIPSDMQSKCWDDGYKNLIENKIK